MIDNTNHSRATPGPVALVSMPWFWSYMPSIQLAIIKRCLNDLGVESNVFEFYADFVKLTGQALYTTIANSEPYLADGLFTQDYYGDRREAEPGMSQCSSLSLVDVESELRLLFPPVIDRFLDACLADTDWSQFRAICFSLTAQQTGASMALAKRIKEHCPDQFIVVGGAACHGEMGAALLELCPEFDVAVQGEAEHVLPELIRALDGQMSWAEVSGVSWRDVHGEVRRNSSTKLHQLRIPRSALNFDAYFDRIRRTGALQLKQVWIPFESSRGCWYGEKTQCTFCGLNEIIQYRERDNGGLLAELESYERRYAVTSFFAVDLIMPRSFFKGFLPDLEKAGKDWKIFYEVKSNMRREEIALLSRSGVTWIQPGIESLDDDVLALMRKGVKAAHNVQTLRLSLEGNVAVSWNIIFGFPGEKPESYFSMAALFPSLHHLDPPGGLGVFEVHRFSPFHDSPEALGIVVKGPHPKYRSVFPVDEKLLNRLVYRFEFDFIQAPGADLARAHAAVSGAVVAWQDARRRGAAFEAIELSSGEMLLKDSRHTSSAVTTRLSAHQSVLLGYLLEMRAEARLEAEFERFAPSAYRALGGREGLPRLLDRWERDGIVLKLSGYVQGLPTLQSASVPDEFLSRSRPAPVEEIAA
ncbi:MAG: RiPP maturation radical SAM C-methyltransferase [Sphingomonas sp.]|uniref:RiPP maturation radical SAM C-methyltransferase n=1 Tax=Sphingomonas sp. TaxID=28214 RepID=UPI001ACCF748|nr:RiPP maturation radical SAM C-methyltransferase [Sphingomonas sp.]MBN8808398.1 RiPP maturation radical SAM C-methyltransferase [Sphingomonas sp.]